MTFERVQTTGVTIPLPAVELYVRLVRSKRRLCPMCSRRRVLYAVRLSDRLSDLLAESLSVYRCARCWDIR